MSMNKKDGSPPTKV